MGRELFTRLENLDTRLTGLTSFVTTIMSAVNEDIIAISDVKETLVLLTNLMSDACIELSDIIAKVHGQKSA